MRRSVVRTSSFSPVLPTRGRSMVEPLEMRQLLSASAVPAASRWATPAYQVVRAPGTGPALVGPAAPIAADSGGSSPGPGFTPNQLRTAYGLGNYGSSPLTFNGVQADGRGETVAIVDAGDDPYAATDLNTFSQQFGLPLVNQAGGPTFTKLNQNGGTSLPAPAGGWVGEESLDIEWFHAIAPMANIILFEASDLDTAVVTAAHYPGVVAVSMSYGGGESSGSPSDNGEYTTPAGHTGVTFLAATGDGGAGVSYPAASPNVVAVGGTDLNTASSAGTYASESGWNDGGGGVSQYEAQPAYQAGTVSAYSTTQRTVPDVSIDAGSGVPICDSYDNGTATPWTPSPYEIIGTSLATPLWAGFVALADQDRAARGYTSLDGATQTLPRLYQLAQGDFHDVTQDDNGTPVQDGGVGYDLNSGRGTPIAAQLIPDLAGLSLPAPWTSVDVGSPTLAGPSFYTPFSPSAITVVGSGTDIWNASDQFHFDYQSVNGNGSVTAQLTASPVLDTDGTQSFAAKGAVMYRASTAANAAFVTVSDTNGIGVQLLYRSATGAVAAQAGSTAAATGPVYLRLTRVSSTYTGWLSTNGTTWTEVASVTDSAVGAATLAGLAVTSHTTTGIAAARFDDVAVLTSTDINSPGRAGFTTYGSAGMTLTGSGSDIWNATDQFHFDDESVSGNGSVVAEVNAIPVADTDGTQGNSAKAGVMYRASTVGNAAMAELVYTNDYGIQLLYRTATGATAVQAGRNVTVSGTGPLYLRLVRSGSTYSGYSSTNGTTWTLVATATDSAVGNTALAGVIACAHNNAKLASVTYGDVSVDDA